MIEVRRSEEQRAVRRSIRGSEDYDFTLILYSQVVAALWRENSDSDERQRDAAFAAMTNMQPHDALERLFGEARRRTKVIPHAFGERAVLKLV